MAQKSRKATAEAAEAKEAAAAAEPTDSKEPKRPRGRPRAYDTNEALAQARDTFWRNGYGATSLDDLSAATGMNRPSLYGAFGDKRALYLSTLDRYIDLNRQGMHHVLAADEPLAQALLRTYDLALSLYFPPDSESKGCFLIGTATVEAVTDEDVRTRLANGLRAFDHAFEVRFRRAQQQGEIDADGDPGTLARLASAILHSLALRSRAGDKRATLRATAAAGVAMLCATAAHTTESQDEESPRTRHKTARG
jgi:TetR/AcrR family transcriptional regulator, copper-responsive repressor